MNRLFGSLLVVPIVAILSGYAQEAAASSSTGSLQMNIAHETQLTRPDGVAKNLAVGDRTAEPPVKLTWNDLVLRRGKEEAVVPVDLVVEFSPVFGAKAGDVVMNAIEIVGGRMTVDPSGRAEVWTIRSGYFGNQSARSNFNTATGNLHLVFPVILSNGAGVRAGTYLAALCSRGESDWQCTEGEIVFEDMRRASAPNAEMDDLIKRWIPAS